jgi:hypothetical protein
VAHHLDGSPSPRALLQTLTREQILPGDPDVVYRLRLHGVPIRWLTRIEIWEPGVRFADAAFVQRDLERIFDFRYEEVARRLGARTTTGA